MFRPIASPELAEVPLRTALSAQSALRPRSTARPRILATEFSISLARRSEFRLLPLASIGVAAPITVLGAIAATCEAKVMYVPADAAWPPDGHTYTTTRTFAAR